MKVNNRSIVSKLKRKLDLGESEAIALSLELKSDLLIIDEIKGREIAKKFGKRIIGMIGILLEAKKHGFIERVEPELNLLRNTGFRMSDKLYQLALRESGEIAINE